MLYEVITILSTDSRAARRKSNAVVLENWHKFRNLVNCAVHRRQGGLRKRRDQVVRPMYDAIEQHFALPGRYPLILTLDTHGVPHLV